MHDYMKALYYRFDSPTRHMRSLEQQRNNIHRQLVKQLDQQQHKLLLRLIDLEGTLRDEACLHSFMSGYRLAQGIQQELLADQPSYSYDAEEARRSGQLLSQNRNNEQ